MFTKYTLAAALAGAVLALGTAPAGAADKAHAHEASHHHHDGAAKLGLDHGRKWATDDALRTGMSNMRGEMSRSLHRIHEGRMDPAGYDRLAHRLEGEVAKVVANCRLAPEADAQLHLVLAQLSEGMDAMKSGARREDGAAKVVEALNAYGAHFDHPGWKRIPH